ncbi:MAG TPA: hypothetical protein VGA72_13805 [Anaerolineales bacterium]
MVEIQSQSSGNVNADVLVRVVEHICVANGLTCTMKGTLAGYPGCVHWHFRKGKQKGLLEITWWELERRLWFKVAQNRKGEWIEDGILLLKEQIERSLYEIPKPDQTDRASSR